MIKATIQTQACFLCGSSTFHTLLHIDKPDRFETSLGILSNNYQRRWDECAGCGLVFNRHLPHHQSQLKSLAEKYYEVDFVNTSIMEKYQKVMTLPPSKSDNTGRVKRIRDFLQGWFVAFPKAKPPYRVLDIGAGIGVFLSRFLKEAGVDWQGVGIEPDPHAAHHLRTLGLFQVVEDTYRGQDPLTDFTLCTLNKVLEHLEDPLHLLRSIRRALRPNQGVLYVEVPDKSTIQSRPPTDNILGSLHFHLYDTSCLTRLLTESGFAVLHAEKLFEPSGKITVAAWAALPEGIQARSTGGAP